MAHLLPSDVSNLTLSLGQTAELRTVETLRTSLSSDYTVFHTVHWSRDSEYRISLGETDFVIVNQSGECVVIEQKAGALEETNDGLIKRYENGSKNVAIQIHRTLNGIRDQFRRQSGRDISLDYLIYCPDHRLRDLNAVGLTASRIVDARDSLHLADRVIKFLSPGHSTDHGKRVHRFFENCFHLVPDIHAHVMAGERAMVRLSQSLVDTLFSIDMTPFRLWLKGTAGCGKSILAARYIDAATVAGKRPLLVCFNRPLAERLKIMAPHSATVNTFYGLMDQFLEARGHALNYADINTPGFWDKVQDRVIGESIEDDWKFDTLVVDEGQDFEPQWAEILQLFLRPNADILWLEDPDQKIRMQQDGNSAQVPSYSKFGPGFVGYQARANFRSPETIARYILRALPFNFTPANALPGLGVGVHTYKQAEDQKKRVAAIVTELLRTGFKHGDIAILSMRGLGRASFAQEARIGTFTLARPTGGYDLLGNQVFEKGQLRFDTVYRFKGQQAPAIILTDIEPNENRSDHTDRLLFAAMTRAMVRLELVARDGNALAERLLNAQS
jgi:hypothetical protein